MTACHVESDLAPIARVHFENELARRGFRRGAPASEVAFGQPVVVVLGVDIGERTDRFAKDFAATGEVRGAVARFGHLALVRDSAAGHTHPWNSGWRDVGSDDALAGKGPIHTSPRSLSCWL